MSLKPTNRFSLAASGLVLAGLALRLLGLGARPLWFDEVISVVYARQDVPTLFALNSGDNHPIGYYLALKGWISLFGTSDAAVRLLSVLPGVGALWLVWLIGRRLFPSQPFIALTALTFAALSPFQIYFSQEARNYSFLEFFSLAAVWFWLRASNDNRWSNWILLGLSGSLGLIFNFTMAFYLAPLGILPLLKARRNWQSGILPRMFVTAFGAGLLSILVLLPKLMSRLTAIKGNFWIPTPNPLLVLRTFYTFIFGAIEAERFLAAFALSLAILFVTLSQSLPAAYRILRFSGDAKFDESQKGLSYTLWLLVAPLALVGLVSLIFQPLYLDKALIGCAPFYYLLIGWSIFQPGYRRKIWWGRVLVTSLVPLAALLLGLAALPDLYNGTIAPTYIARYNAVRINTYLQQNSQPGDVAAAATDISWLPLVYYGPGQFPPKFPIQEYPYPNIFPLLLEKTGSKFVSEDEFGTKTGAKRLWVVFEVNAPEPSLQEPPRSVALTGETDWFHSREWQSGLLAHYDKEYKRVQAVAFDRVILVLYEL